MCSDYDGFFGRLWYGGRRVRLRSERRMTYWNEKGQEEGTAVVIMRTPGHKNLMNELGILHVRNPRPQRRNRKLAQMIIPSYKVVV